MKTLNLVFAILSFTFLSLTFYMLFNDNTHRPGWDNYDKALSVVLPCLLTLICTLLSIKNYKPKHSNQYGKR